jgi:hypothetical protein
MQFIDHAETVCLLRRDRFAGHQYLHGLPRREHSGKQDRRATAGRQADHRFRLAEHGIVGRDDEVATDGDLAATAVGHSMDRGDDRPAQLPQCVQHAVEDLPLPQPLLLRHALALTQVAADGEGALPGPADDDAAHRDARSHRLQRLDQAGSEFGRDRVVGVRPVQRDDRDPSFGNPLDENDSIRLRCGLWGAITQPLHPRTYLGLDHGDLRSGVHGLTPEDACGTVR